MQIATIEFARDVAGISDAHSSEFDEQCKHKVIREELERACSREGIKAHFADYRPFYDEATRRSREGGMYRQNYCGCRFSDAEAAAEREERRAARRAAREAELAAHADERAAAEAERARTRAEKQAYADKQAKKRAILKALREQR